MWSYCIQPYKSTFNWPPWSQKAMGIDQGGPKIVSPSTSFPFTLWKYSNWFYFYWTDSLVFNGRSFFQLRFHDKELYFPICSCLALFVVVVELLVALESPLNRNVQSELGVGGTERVGLGTVSVLAHPQKLEWTELDSSELDWTGPKDGFRLHKVRMSNSRPISKSRQLGPKVLRGRWD